MNVRVVGGINREDIGRVFEVESEHLTENGIHWYFVWTHSEHEASYIMHMEIVDGEVFAHLYFGE